MSNINKQFGKDLIINSTTDAAGSSVGSIVTFGGANIDKKLFLGSSYSAPQLGNTTGAFLTVNDNAVFLDTTSTSTNSTAFWSNYIGNNSIATTNANVTFGTSGTLYIDGPPVAGTNVTLNNPWSIYLNTGGSYFGGSVSINTTSVTQALSVNGNINFTGNLYQNGSVYSGSTQWGSTGANIYFNTGNVGVGTASPGAPLDVRVAGDNGNLIAQFGSNSGTSTGRIMFYDQVFPGSAGPRILFAAGNIGVIQGSGNIGLVPTSNVGIGNTSPSITLDVSGSLGMKTSNTSTWDHVYFTHDGSGAFMRAGGVENGLAFELNAASSGSYGSSSYTRVMTLMSSGNVGIGTTSPNTTLDVNGNIRLPFSTSTGSFRIISGVPSDNFIYQNNTVGHYSIMWPTADIYNTLGGGAPMYLTAYGGIRFFALGNERMTISYNGNVGIATTNPGYTLDVSGSTRVSSGFLYLTSATGSNSVIQQTAATSGITISSVSGTAAGGSWIELYDAARFGGTMVLGYGSSGIQMRDSSNTTYTSFAKNQVLLNAGPGLAIQGSTASTNTVLPLNILFNAENYSPTGGSSLKNSFYNAGTLVVINTMNNITSGNNTASLIDFGAYVPGGGNTNVFAGCVSGTSTNGPGNFVIGRRTGVTSWTESLRIATSGNVGIGTSSPGTLLNVSGGNILLSAGNQTGRIAIQNNSTGTSLASGGTQIVQDGVNAYLINYKPNQRLFVANNNIMAMTVTSAGNVGIGTTSPIYTLDVNGTARFNAANLYLTNSNISTIQQTNFTSGLVLASASGSGAGGGAWIEMYDRYSNGGVMVLGHGAGYGQGGLLIRDTTNTNYTSFSRTGFSLASGTALNAQNNSNTIGNIFTIGGNVGIGTTSPISTLDVSGSVNASAGVTIGNTLAFNNTNNTPRIMFFGGDSANSFHGIAQASSSIRITVPNSGTHFLSFGSNTGGNYAEHMRIQNNGNVGIGTVSPGGRLHLFESTGTAPGGNTGSIVLSRGNTGGSSSISFLSTINPNSDYGYIQFIETVTATGFTGYNYFGGTGPEVAALLIGCENDGTGGSGPDSVIISPSGNVAITPRNNVTYISGTVGIGTTQPNTGYSTTIPNAKLSILSGVAGSTAGTSRLSIGGDNSHYSAIEGAHTASGSTTLAFMTCTNASTNSANPLTRMFIDANGNVGIGTTSPGSALDVVGIMSVSSSDTWQTVSLIKNTSNNQQWNWAVGGSSNSTIGSRAISLYDASQDKFRITVNSVGNVGIGTVSPIGNLTINGSNNGNGVLQVVSLSSSINGGRNQDGASFQAWADNNIIISFFNAAGTIRGSIVGNGASAVTFSTSSDRRLKKNIVNMRSTRDLIKQIRTREFDWTADNVHGYGFIAQEIYELFPEMRPIFSNYSHCECCLEETTNGVLCECENHNHDEPVDYDGKPLYYGLDYGRFTPYLTKALQETMVDLEAAQATIEAQQATIGAQQATIGALQAKTEAQQAQIDRLVTLIQQKFPGELTE